MALRKLVRRNYGGKSLVSIKYQNLRSFKEGMILLFQSILESRWISHLHGSALFKIPLKTRHLFNSSNIYLKPEHFLKSKFTLSKVKVKIKISWQYIQPFTIPLIKSKLKVILKHSMWPHFRIVSKRLTLIDFFRQGTLCNILHGFFFVLLYLEPS